MMMKYDIFTVFIYYELSTSYVYIKQIKTLWLRWNLITGKKNISFI